MFSRLGAPIPFDKDNRFTTSFLLPTLVFALLRLLISLYAFVTIFFIFGWDSTHGQSRDARRWFAYFTNLSFIGLAFYFLLAGLHTLKFSVNGNSWLNGWPRGLQVAHSILYTTAVVFPPLVTIVYWVVLYESWFTVTEKAWSNVSVDLGNACRQASDPGRYLNMV